MRFQFEPGSSEQQAFEDLRKYGKPLTANVAVDSDLPGGLGGSFDNATASISAAGDGVKGETRYRIVSPEGTVVAELWFAVTSTKGLDGTGVYVKRRDTSGTVLIEGHFDATDRSGKIEFTFIEVARPGVTEIAPAVEFISNLSQPNRLQIAGKYGPFQDLHNNPEAEAPLPQFVARYITALEALQPHTATPIVVTDLATVTEQLAQCVLTAANLLDGQTIISTWKPLEFEINGDASINTNGHYQLATIEALAVEVGNQRYYSALPRYAPLRKTYVPRRRTASRGAAPQRHGSADFRSRRAMP